ncbi:MAG TPA: hypothetical protein PKB10_09645 [Tepidisphaeraceae bacterium]|nr:hypothetical protein [Tepidisphaeraceae bacterium]
MSQFTLELPDEAAELVREQARRLGYPSPEAYLRDMVSEVAQHDAMDGPPLLRVTSLDELRSRLNAADQAPAEVFDSLEQLKRRIGA